jgi:ribosomal protein L28
MARVCEICDKKKSIGHTRKLLRGHYNVTGKREFKPNLQRTKVDGHHVLACVNCIRTLHKEAKLKTA